MHGHRAYTNNEEGNANEEIKEEGEDEEGKADRQHQEDGEGEEGRVNHNITCDGCDKVCPSLRSLKDTC